MPTEIDICNKAILRLGGNMVTSSDGTVAALQPVSLEAKLCMLNYALIRDIVTENFVWSFAIERVILDTPNPIPPLFGYAQSFPLPANVLNVWRVFYWQTSGVANQDSSEQINDWRVEGLNLLANSTQVNVEYIRRMDQVNDLALFTPQALDALSLRLAVEFCIPITENGGLFQTLTQEYQKRVADAYSINGSQAKSEIIRSRQLTRVR